MKKTAFTFLALAAGALALAGCGGEEKAQAGLTKFEHVFQVCKDQTLLKGLEPGKHTCSLISSVALDKVLHDSGVSDGKMAQMRDEWIEQKGFKGFYIPAEKR